MVYSLVRPDVDSRAQRGSTDLKSMVHMSTWTTNPTGVKTVVHVGNQSGIAHMAHSPGAMAARPGGCKPIAHMAHTAHAARKNLGL